MPPTMHSRVRCASAPTTSPAMREIQMGACIEPGPFSLKRMNAGAAQSRPKRATWTTDSQTPSTAGRV